MQDKHVPPSPPEVSDLNWDPEMVSESDIEEVTDLNNSIFESASSSEGENENSSTVNHVQKDDAMCVFRGDLSEAFCCSLSKNGELAVTGDVLKAYLWNTNTGESIFNTGTSHDDSLTFAEFNHTDEYVVTADIRGNIRLWKISDKTCVWETTLAKDITVTWVQWHQSCDILIAGVMTGEVYMLKTLYDDCRVFVHGIGDMSETGIILPDGIGAVIGYHSGTIHVIDLKSNAVLSTTPPDQTRSRGHASAIIDLDCYMDNNLLISVSKSQTILSTAHNGKVICILQDLNKNGNNINNVAQTAAFSKDPTFPAAATGTITSRMKGKIYIWDIFKQTLRHEMDQEGGVMKLVWTKTGILFTAGTDGKMRSFDARAGHCLQLFSGHNSILLDFCISSNEKKH